jgi:hypothetical protein
MIWLSYSTWKVTEDELRTTEELRRSQEADDESNYPGPTSTSSNAPTSNSNEFQGRLLLEQLMAG